MLHRFDDYPVHQSAQPLLHVDSLSLNAFDRYFFNGYRPDGSVFFAATLGLYPNRGVIDAAFSVAVGGEQFSTLASGRAPLDRTRTRVGPLSVEIIEPMKTLRVLCRGGEGAIDADLIFHADTPAVEEPRFSLVQDSTTVYDFTRLAQWGYWEGELTVDGRRIDIDAKVVGCRDRSWGVRPIAAGVAGLDGPSGADGVAPSTRPPQTFWLWAPLHFEGAAVHFDVNEFSDGRRWHGFGAIVPKLFDGLELAVPADAAAVRAAAEAAEEALVAPPIVMRAAEYVLDWEPGTRHTAMASIILEPFGGADTHIIRLEPILTFPMAGLGYGHPEWGHGRWHGENETVSWRWRLDELDPAAPTNLHVQQLVTARWGPNLGIGVLEQLALGNHGPTGLSGLYDGAS